MHQCSVSMHAWSGSHRRINSAPVISPRRVCKRPASRAGGIGLLAAALICQALLPARKIIAGLKCLEVGDDRPRLPGYRMAEFSHVAREANELTDRLEQTTAGRAALTQQLLAVQEEKERRALARGLHDEFEQCPTATGALAAAMEAGAAGSPDLADGERAITRGVETRDGDHTGNGRGSKGAIPR